MPKHKHAEVVGIELPAMMDVSTFNEWIDKHFRSTKPPTPAAKLFKADRRLEAFGECIQAAKVTKLIVSNINVCLQIESENV